jgi:hypothetical protein
MPLNPVSAIGGQDQLVVCPSDDPTGMFPYVYRSGTGVRWDAQCKSFVSPVPREWSHVNCFSQILTAVKSEIGVRLVLSHSTRWRNVPVETQHAIELAASESAT